jgi:SAM-dependent methyltransferase
MSSQGDTARTYYSEKLKQHGATARGVDWPSAASQYLRFVQLLKLCDFSRPFSINDFGCGYGALLEYFEYRHPEAAIRYHGIDISPPMIEAAELRWKHHAPARFSIGSECHDAADYSLASGVFNIKLDWPVGEWEAYVKSILINLRAKSRRGFSVNFMLPLDEPSDEQSLYRTTPDRWMDFLKELDCSAEQISDYGLREFTLLARIPSIGEAPGF